MKITLTDNEMVLVHRVLVMEAQNIDFQLVGDRWDKKLSETLESYVQLIDYFENKRDTLKLKEETT